VDRESYQPGRITEPKLLLAEGADACYFCIWAKQAYGVTGLQVMDFGGIGELARRLQTVQLVTGYDVVESLGVIRDAEEDAAAAFASVRGAFDKAGLTAPSQPYEVAAGSPRTGVFLFPGPAPDEGGPRCGTLEDLCMATVENQPVRHCIDSFMDCLRQAGGDLRRPHKARVHSYLAGNNSFVGLKLGEAAKAGAWDWRHRQMEPFERFLRTL